MRTGGDVGKRAAERREGAAGLVSERVREVDGACSGVTEEISRSGGDTVRARVRQPMTDSHGCDGRTGATWCSRRWGGNVEGRQMYGCRVRARREMEMAVSAGKGVERWLREERTSVTYLGGGTSGVRRTTATE